MIKKEKEKASNKEEVGAGATADNTQAVAEKVDLDSAKKDKVENQGEETVMELDVENNIQNLLDLGNGVYDWAKETATDPDDPLFKTRMEIKQQITEDCSLNNSQGDSEHCDGDEDEFSPVSNIKRPLSSPPAASPSKVIKQSESPPSGQHVEEGSPPSLTL